MSASAVRPPAVSGVRLLEALPELEVAIPAEDHDLARRALVVPSVALEPGERIPDGPRQRPLARMLVEGLVLRRTSLGGRAAAEVLGRGDVLVDDDAASTALLSMKLEHVAHERTTVALLDDRFRLAARRWPGLHDLVQAQTARQVGRASRNLAILHLARVEDRLTAVFTELVERWGHVTPEGVALDVDLTHSMLGELVGARRPTVSLALTTLAERGVVTRGEDRRWVVSPEVLG